LQEIIGSRGNIVRGARAKAAGEVDTRSRRSKDLAKLPCCTHFLQVTDVVAEISGGIIDVDGFCCCQGSLKSFSLQHAQ